MKHGFTLTELLAVLVIVGILGIISISAVSKLQQTAKEKLYTEQVNRITEAASKWAIDNTDQLPEETAIPSYVSIETLKKVGLLENIDIIDPYNQEKMLGCVEITYDDKYDTEDTQVGTYQYSYITDSTRCTD